MALLFLNTLALSFGFFDSDFLGRPGQCLAEAPLENFNIDFFDGVFYQIFRSTPDMNEYSDCNMMEFIKRDETSFDVIKYVLSTDMAMYQDVYSIEFDSSRDLGKFTEIHEEGTRVGRIIDTDFDKYFVSYYCKPFAGQKRDFIELYSKDINFDPSPYYHLASDRGINQQELALTKFDSMFCIEPDFRHN